MGSEMCIRDRGQTGLGALSDRQGFSAGYVVGGLVTLLAMPLLWLVRRQRDDSDFFSGSRPEFACAAPGVPAISGVDGGVTVDVT